MGHNRLHGHQFGSVHVIIDITGFYIDHDHDDRYYPRADVDAKIATVDGEVLDPSGSETHSFDFEIEREWPVDETATSSIAGRWQISKFFRGGTSCTPSNAVGRIFFLTVDDLPVESSMFYVSNSDVFNVMLSGITEGVIEPGEHVIGVGAECSDDSTSGSFSSLDISPSAVVVIPE